jgi:GT2 family glycosyltransferase
MISIIVLHHDKAEYSRACLESLLLSSARPLEVVSIDNGSRDDTPRVLEEWSVTARAAGVATQLHRFETNAGQ